MSTIPPNTADTVPSALSDTGGHFVDVSALFEPFGIKQKIEALFTPVTYEFAPIPENNWLYAAFKGFQALKESAPLKWVHTFASVGTGPGLDGIGASHIFKPAHVVLTDKKKQVLPIALCNIHAHLQNERIKVTVAKGNLCAPLRDKGIYADLIYANLPLLPDPEGNDEGMRSSTFVPTEELQDVPEIYQHSRLAMIYLFLNDARSSLNEGGSVAINLGGRVPVALIQQLFRECGYQYRELFSMLKVQSQPYDVLPEFSKAELETGITFDFYRMNDETKHSLTAYSQLYGVFGKTMNAHQMKEDALKEFRVSATDALKLHQAGETIGHVVQMIQGLPLS
ncbi:hypothetical protein EXS70_03295 [Candidatus Peribacteria bacterium]|nr:hypothetical protein [Candidatus Peribacteria bacterium]